MFPMGYMGHGGDAGTYTVTVNGDKTDIEADSLEYPDDGSIRVWKDGVVVATFRWWDSIVKKDT